MRSGHALSPRRGRHRSTHRERPRTAAPESLCSELEQERAGCRLCARAGSGICAPKCECLLSMHLGVHLRVLLSAILRHPARRVRIGLGLGLGDAKAIYYRTTHHVHYCASKRNTKKDYCYCYWGAGLAASCICAFKCECLLISVLLHCTIVHMSVEY